MAPGASSSLILLAQAFPSSTVGASKASLPLTMLFELKGKVASGESRACARMDALSWVFGCHDNNGHSQAKLTATNLPQSTDIAPRCTPCCCFSCPAEGCLLQPTLHSVHVWCGGAGGEGHQPKGGWGCGVVALLPPTSGSLDGESPCCSALVREHNKEAAQ